MVGEFNGKRFEIGTVTVQTSNETDWEGHLVCDLFAKRPAFDTEGGQSVWLTTVCGVKKANNLANKLNA